MTEDDRKKSFSGRDLQRGDPEDHEGLSGVGLPSNGINKIQTTSFSAGDMFDTLRGYIYARPDVRKMVSELCPRHRGPGGFVCSMLHPTTCRPVDPSDFFSETSLLPWSTAEEILRRFEGLSTSDPDTDLGRQNRESYEWIVSTNPDTHFLIVFVVYEASTMSLPRTGNFNEPFMVYTSFFARYRDGMLYTNNEHFLETGVHRLSSDAVPERETHVESVVVDVCANVECPARFDGIHGNEFPGRVIRKLKACAGCGMVQYCWYVPASTVLPPSRLVSDDTLILCARAAPNVKRRTGLLTN